MEEPTPEQIKDKRRKWIIAIAILVITVPNAIFFTYMYYTLFIEFAPPDVGNLYVMTPGNCTVTSGPETITFGVINTGKYAVSASDVRFVRNEKTVPMVLERDPLPAFENTTIIIYDDCARPGIWQVCGYDLVPTRKNLQFSTKYVAVECGFYPP